MTCFPSGNNYVIFCLLFYAIVCLVFYASIGNSVPGFLHEPFKKPFVMVSYTLSLACFSLGDLGAVCLPAADWTPP